MTPYELLELVRRINNTSETIQILNDLLMEIDKNPNKYIHKLSEEICDFAKHFNRCPLCGDKLEEITHQEDRGECFGFSSQETMYRYECSNPECSYTEE
jgi:uncharacterized protein with PIN domain